MTTTAVRPADIEDVIAAARSAVPVLAARSAVPVLAANAGRADHVGSWHVQFNPYLAVENHARQLADVEAATAAER
jgi:hypothetical protein